MSLEADLAPMAKTLRQYTLNRCRVFPSKPVPGLSQRTLRLHVIRYFFRLNFFFGCWLVWKMR